MAFPIRMLLIGDGISDTDLILRELGAASFTVTARRAGTAQQVREQLALPDLDVIVAGYGLDSDTILTIAREIAPEVPLIFIGGAIGENRVAEALRNGAADYVLRDRLPDLARAVRHALDRRKRGDRRRAEEDAIRLSRQQFEYVVKATSDALWDWDFARDGILEVDPHQPAAGSDRDQHDVAWWFGRVHPDDRERVQASLRASLEQREERWGTEYRFRLGAEGYVPVFSRAFLIRDPRGNPIRVVGALQDSTEQRKAEAAMRESKLRCHSVAESAADAIFLTTADCTIIYANQRAGRMFGRTPDEMVGQNFVAFLPQEICDEHLNTIRELGRSGVQTSAMRSMAGLRADGSEFSIELSIAAFTRDGELFFTKIVRDVSDRLASERLHHVQFEVTRLLAATLRPAELLPQLIDVMTTGFGWQGAALWLLDPLSRRLTCASVSMAEGREPAVAACRETSFGEGEGLPGLAFKSGCAETVAITDSDESPHHAAAAGGGILRVTAVPMGTGGARLGVIEFFERDGSQPEPAMLEVTTEIAAQAGHYLEHALREEERVAALERLREAQHLAHVGSWEYDIQTGASSSSEETYAIFGIDPAVAFSFDGYFESVHSEDRDRVFETVRSQFSTGTPITVHFQYRIDRAGEERILETRSRVIVDDDGVPMRAVGSVQDITDQAYADRTIERLSRRSDLILECAGEGIVGIDINGAMTFSNPALRTMVGWSDEQLRACDDLHALLHHTKTDGTPYPREECPLYLTLRDGQKRSVTGEYFWRPDGPFFADYECAAIIEGGEIAGAVMTCHDVTESHRLNRQLELSKRIGSLGRVAATIAHEFNNVLMGIEPFAEIVRRRVKNDEKVSMAANQISSSVRRGRRVTDEILRFTRPVELTLKDVDLKAWLLQLEPELRALAGPNAHLIFDLPSTPTYAACDAAQLQQVITNLVLNARDAMPKRGKIFIALRRQGAHHVELILRDTGPGIPEHEVFNIFEPLYTTKRGGTGLGLAVARRIVTQHGGSIDASNPEGGGAQFCVILPIGTAAALEPHTTTAALSDAHNLLLVEDEEAVAAGLLMLLDAEGFVVKWVGLGGDVIGEAAKSRPDCVILDLTLPDIDGIEVFRMIRDRWPGMPVVFSTGHGGVAEVADALEGGHAVLLQKPYEIDALITAVHWAATS